MGKKTQIQVIPKLDKGIPWGFSDGASQCHPPLCGVAVLFMNQNLYMHIRYAPGKGSNNTTVFITLRTLLVITLEKGAKQLQVMRDYMLVIDWASNNATVVNACMRPLPQEIQETIRGFDWLSFRHIYRELNSKACELSKEAISLPIRTFYEYVDGVKSKSMEFQL